MLAHSRSTHRSFYRSVGKRWCDVLLGGLFLLVLAPVIATTWLLVLWWLGSPVMFRQQRAGLHGRVFTLLKFRSMLGAKGADEKTLPDEMRITTFGSVLRRLSLDELPQLINVVRGDMSLVGPRPLLVRYLDRYDEHQARRHEVRPGITGLAQVCGRNALSWPEKFDLDVEYVDRLSPWLDTKILMATARKLLLSQDISAAGYATAPEFLGNEESAPRGSET